MVNQTEAEQFLRMLAASGPSLAQDGIVAYAGGGQSGAFPLNARYNRIVTIANANDSVRLPMATAGAHVYIIQSAGYTTTLAIYANGSDVIDSLSAGTPYAMTGGDGAVIQMICIKQGQWHALVGA